MACVEFHRVATSRMTINLRRRTSSGLLLVYDCCAHCRRRARRWGDEAIFVAMSRSCTVTKV